MVNCEADAVAITMNNDDSVSVTHLVSTNDSFVVKPVSSDDHRL